MIEFNLIVFSSIRWGFLWQRPHQIASLLASRGHHVIYFQNPYILTPSILIENYKEKNIFLLRKVMKNLYVANIFIPPFLGKLSFFTEKCGSLFFKVYVKCLNFKPDVAIFHSLSGIFLLNLLRPTDVKIIYDCIDDFSSFPDVRDVSSILSAEKKLAAKASFVTAASKTLFERLREYNMNCFYVPNAADFRHFNSAIGLQEQPKAIRNLKRPIIGFIGAIWDWIDVDLICKLAEIHPEYSFLLVGPVNFGLSKLERYSNIKLVGAKPYRDLPLYLACMDVCLIPFKINKLTLASNPIKLYEYLAAGKPVVSTALPEICENAADLVYIARDEEDFIKKVEDAVNEAANPNKKVIRRRIEFAKENSWEKRIETIEELLRRSW